MRLIDADALLNNIRRAVYPSDLATTIAVGICESHVKDMPTVDSEPVVRCKQCKHYRDNGAHSTKWLPCQEVQVPEKWFCADGEMMEEKENDNLRLRNGGYCCGTSNSGVL